MKVKEIVLVITSLALLAAGQTALAGTHIWSGAVNGYWSNPGNWSSGGAPAIGEAAPVTLNFPEGAVRYNTTNDLGALIFFIQADYIIVTGNNYLFAGGNQPTPALGLTGYSGGAYINLYCTGTNVVFDSSLELYLSATNLVDVDTGAALTFSSPITGPGGLTFYSAGTTYFQGSATNTFTGTVNVQSGNVYLGNYWIDTICDFYSCESYFVGAPSIGGALIIGANASSTAANVYVPHGFQFHTNCNITINPTGALWVKSDYADTNLWEDFGVSDNQLYLTCSSLTLNGGSLYLGRCVYVDYTDSYGDIFLATNSAGLTVTGPVVSCLSPNPATISRVYGGGNIELGGPTTVASGLLLLGCTSHGLNKSGPGTLVLEQVGLHYSPIIAQGLCALISSGVGTWDSLTISNGAEMDITAPCTLWGNLVLQGRGVQGNGGALTVESSGVIFNLAASLSMSDDTAIDVVNPTDQLLLMARNGSYSYVSGTNNFYKLGAGNLTFADFSPNAINPITTNSYVALSNLFSGTFYVQGGTVNFNSAYPPVPGSGVDASPFGLALNGPIVIGTNGSTVSCTVELDANEQLNTNVSITINDGCHFNIEGTNQQTVGTLTLNGGVVAGLGEIVLHSNVTANFATYQPFIYAGLSLGGASRTFMVGSNTTLSVQGVITDGGNAAGITKAGPGELQLAASNPYRGFTDVNAGRLGLYNSGTPGSANSWTIVNAGGELDLEGGVNVNQALLSLAGSGADGAGVLKGSGQNFWTGPVGASSNLTVNIASNGLVVLNGLLSCTIGGLTKTGLGTLELAGSYSNSYPGTTFVQQGTLWLNKTNALAVPGPLVVGTGFGPANSVLVELFQSGQLNPSAGVTLNSDGLLDLAPITSSTVGSLYGGGELNLGFAQLSVGSDNTSGTFSGPIVGLGNAALVKAGTGAWTLSGTSSFFGQTRVGSGSLFVDGYLGNSSMFVSNSATLGGNGTVGALTALGGSTISPGHGPGVLTSGSATFSPGSTYLLKISGTNAAYNQLNVSGTVTENNPTLQVVMTTPGGTNYHYLFINNDLADPVSGTFAGLQEGATVVANNGVHFTISYQGNTGNDVELTQTSVPVPPGLTGITRLTNGNIILTGTGAPNVTYHVLANTNLATTNWVNLGPITANNLGALIFTDSQAGLYPERFYRFVYP